jgi:hypothetical protein
MPLRTPQQVRAGTSSQWTTANTVLLSQELGYETNTGRFKLGDGTTVWTSLGYYLEASPFTLKSYTVATVPAAASWTAAMIYVTDETGGAIPAFSDGTNWRRVSDRTIIS